VKSLIAHSFLGVIALLMIAVLAAIFGDTVVFGNSSYVPTESSMGIVQRIFYFHVPAALTAFLAFFVAFVASIGYLLTRRLSWDNVARSSVELGVMFCTMVLITGPLWAKPIWGAWWPWEPRLTTTLILWLLYICYLLLRTYSEDRAQQARFCAVLGVVAFLDVPIVYYSVKWWRGVHPIVFGSQGGGISPRMNDVFLGALCTFFLLFGFLLVQRARLANMEDEVENLRAERLDTHHS
jgi:heme exporter protein C